MVKVQQGLLLPFSLAMLKVLGHGVCQQVLFIPKGVYFWLEMHDEMCDFENTQLL